MSGHVKNVKVCNTDSLVCLCDTLADGTQVPFLRRIQTCGNDTTVTDFALDGVTPYTVAGTVGKCGAEDRETHINCYEAIADDSDGTDYTNGDLIELRVLFNVQDPGGPQFTQYFNLSTNQVIYQQDFDGTTTGTIPPIPAEIVPCEADKEWVQILCDSIPTIDQFLGGRSATGLGDQTLRDAACAASAETASPGFTNINTSAAVAATHDGRFIMWVDSLQPFGYSNLSDGHQWYLWDRVLGATVATGPYLGERGLDAAYNPIDGRWYMIQNPAGNAIELVSWDSQTNTLSGPVAIPGGFTQTILGGALVITDDGRFYTTSGNDSIIEFDPVTGATINGPFSLGAGVDQIRTGSYDPQNDELYFRANGLPGNGATVDRALTTVSASPCGAGAVSFAWFPDTVQVQPADTLVEFQRCFTSRNGVVTFVDLDLDGNPYTVQGTAVSCDSVEMEPAQIESREVCVDDGNGNVLPVFAILSVTETATNFLRFEDAIGQVVTGTMVDCECPCTTATPQLFATCLRGFDYLSLTDWFGETGGPGNNAPLQWEVFIDGVSQGISNDVPEIQDDGTKASWYANLIALVNSTSWSASVIAPGSSVSPNETKADIQFSGPAGTMLTLVRQTQTADTLDITLDGAGNATVNFYNTGDPPSQNLASDLIQPCP